MSENPKLELVKGGIKENESNLTPSQRRGKRLGEFLMSINNISDAAFYDFMQWAEDWKNDRTIKCPVCGRIILPDEKYADDETCSFFCHNRYQIAKED